MKVQSSCAHSATHAQNGIGPKRGTGFVRIHVPCANVGQNLITAPRSKTRIAEHDQQVTEKQIETPQRSCDTPAPGAPVKPPQVDGQASLWE
jgi:hypothetical protein